MLWFIFWVRKVTFHSVCMCIIVILLYCFVPPVFTLNLNELWTNTSSRNYTDEKEKKRHFIWVCMFCFHESCLLRTILLCLQLEMGLTFYLVIRAMWRSSRLQSRGSTIPSFLSYQTLSIGLTLVDEPMPFILQPWMHLNPANLLKDQSIPFYSDHL